MTVSRSTHLGLVYVPGWMWSDVMIQMLDVLEYMRVLGVGALLAAERPSDSVIISCWAWALILISFILFSQVLYEPLKCIALGA